MYQRFTSLNQFSIIFTYMYLFNFYFHVNNSSLRKVNERRAITPAKYDILCFVFTPTQKIQNLQYDRIIL